MVDYLSYATFRILGVADPGPLALEVVTFKPEFSDTKFHADGTWVREIETRFGLEVAKETQSTTVYGLPHEILLVDADGNQISNLREVYLKLIAEMREEGVKQRDARTDFDQSVFLRTSSLEVPLVKIAAISTRIDIRETVHQRLGLPNFVEFVLRSVSDGATKHFRMPRVAPDPAPNKSVQPPPTEQRD